MAEIDTTIKIKGDSTGAKKAFGDMDKAIIRSQKSVEGFFKINKAAMLGVAGGMIAVVSILHKAVEEAGEAEIAEAKLGQAMKNAGTYTKGNYESLIEYSKHIQKTTLFTDDATTKAMALMQAYGMQTNTLKLATKAITDLATAKGVDLASAAFVIGKAFAGNTAMLGKYGIIVDKTVLQTKGFTAVLEAMDKTFGKQAETLRNTIPGAMKGVSMAIDEVWEELGKVITQSENGIVSLNKMEGAFLHLSDIIGENQKTIRDWSIIGGSIVGVTTAILALGVTLPPLIRGFGYLRTAMLTMPFVAIASGVAIATEAILALGDAFVKVENDRAKAVNAGVRGKELWQDRINKLKEINAMTLDGTKVVRDANVAMQSWGLSGEKFVIKSREDLPKVIELLRQTRDAMKITPTSTVIPTVTGGAGTETETTKTSAYDKALKSYELYLTQEKAKRDIAIREELKLYQDKLGKVKKTVDEEYAYKMGLAKLEVDLRKQTEEDKANIVKEYTDKQKELAEQQWKDYEERENKAIELQNNLKKEQADRQKQIIDMMTSAYLDSIQTQIQAGQSLTVAFREGFKQILFDYIQMKIKEIMVARIQAIAEASMQIPYGWFKIGIIMAQAAAATAALNAIVMDEGGIVTKPTRAILAKNSQPEAVIPLNRAGDLGFGNNTYNFTISKSIDLALVTEAIRRGNPQAMGFAKQIHKVGRIVGGES